MSRLYCSETGRVVPALCEELTDYRRARKTLILPGTREDARLFLLARAYPGNELPLRIAVNGTDLPGVPAVNPGAYFWREVAVPASLIVPGINIFEFWTGAPAMNAWSLALEDGHREPLSFVTTDAGQTWRNEKLGYLNVARGEYLVRVRLDEGQDPPPPPQIWEAPETPRLHRLREMLPERALRPGPTLDRVRALTTWVSTRWEYRNTSNGDQYAPWDAETIMAWGQAGHGHNGLRPIVMCVHYAVTLVSSCLAAGIPARCAVFTGAINSFTGHFTAEVWFAELGKWVMVDPNVDAVMFRAGIPLSVAEIQAAGSDLTPLVEWGPGYDYQIRNPLIGPWIRDNYLRGICFRHRGVWPRADFLSHPELTPPGHGALCYCETDLVWEARDLSAGFDMFPYFGDPDYFDAPPRGFPQ